MTRQELIDRINRQAKRATFWSVIWLISFFAVLSLLTVVAYHVSPATRTVMSVTFIAFMLGTVASLMLGLWKSMRRLGLVCPHCHVLLTKHLWPVAVASGRCGKCGEQIVDSNA